MNKHGEIVFDDNGNVIEVNGYNGDRKSFEFIELSEYFTIVNFIVKLLEEDAKQSEELRNQIKRLFLKLT